MFHTVKRLYHIHRQCLNSDGTHRNVIPALFGKAERHTGTSRDARGGTLGYRPSVPPRCSALGLTPRA